MKSFPPRAARGGKARQVVAVGVAEEEDAERAELQHELQKRVDVGVSRLVRPALENAHQATPAMARAKSPRGKRLKIFNGFADSDEMDRKPIFRGDRDQYAAARGSVELGHHKAGHACLRAENIHLIQSVLARRRIEGQENVVRGGRILLLQDAQNLDKLGHQLCLVLQPAGGVDQEHVGAGFFRFFKRFEGEAGGVGAGRPGDDRNAHALAPDLELLDGRGAEGIAGAEHYALCFGGEASRELADRRGLAGTVDANDHDDVGRACAVDPQRLRDRREHLLDLGGKDGADLLGADFLVKPLARQRLDHVARGVDAEVGFEKQFLKLLKRFRVELPLGEDLGDAG